MRFRSFLLLVSLLVCGCVTTPQQGHLSVLPHVTPPGFNRTYYTNFSLPDVPPVQLVLTTGNLDARISPLNQGQPAPFNGVLFNGEATATLQVQFRTQQQRCQVDRRADQLGVGARAIADLERLQSEFIANQQANSVFIGGRDREITRLQAEPHYNPWVLTGIGLLGGMSLFGLVYALVN